MNFPPNTPLWVVSGVSVGLRERDESCGVSCVRWAILLRRSNIHFTRPQETSVCIPCRVWGDVYCVVQAHHGQTNIGRFLLPKVIILSLIKTDQLRGTRFSLNASETFGGNENRKGTKMFSLKSHRYENYSRSQCDLSLSTTAGSLAVQKPPPSPGPRKGCHTVTTGSSTWYWY